MLDEARRAGQRVAPVGGATALALGNVPERIDVALSTRALAGILAYEPTDLTLSVLAGTPLSEVQAILAERGQTLPVEVPHASAATIGGVISTNIFGPRRAGSPTFRDLLIGISAAHPDGTVTKAGGMVVKNVSGFDLMRVYLGSLGTLGVVVSANFKVLPLARSEATIVGSFAHPHDALTAAKRVQQSRVRPVSLESFRDGTEWRLALRIEGRESTVRLLAEEAQALMQTNEAIIHGADSTDWWTRYADAQAISCGESDALMRASVRPRRIDEAVSEILHILQGSRFALPCFAVTPGSGQITFKIEPSTVPESDICREFAALQVRVLRSVDNLTVLAAPPAWKRPIDVWGREPATIEVMRAIKREFDPERVLNPGRFAGRI